MQRRLDKQITSTGNTFKAVAEEVLAKLEKEGHADVTLTKKRWLLDFAYPAFGDRPIAEITALRSFRYSAELRRAATMKPRGGCEVPAQHVRYFATPLLPVGLSAIHLPICAAR